MVANIGVKESKNRSNWHDILVLMTWIGSSLFSDWLVNEIQSVWTRETSASVIGGFLTNRKREMLLSHASRPYRNTSHEAPLGKATPLVITFKIRTFVSTSVTQDANMSIRSRKTGISLLRQRWKSISVRKPLDRMSSIHVRWSLQHITTSCSRMTNKNPPSLCLFVSTWGTKHLTRLNALTKTDRLFTSDLDSSTSIWRYPFQRLFSFTKTLPNSKLTLWNYFQTSFQLFV